MARVGPTKTYKHPNKYVSHSPGLGGSRCLYWLTIIHSLQLTSELEVSCFSVLLMVVVARHPLARPQSIVKVYEIFFDIG